ncbi:MAG: DapH/DapD/GlmU-related protein [Rhodocyclaceae bacterium]|nr:DapH/DapD/GlmU-related protein [Rhodocyclaceae bacterium]
MALPIEIGDGCWIGARTIILGGVRMGPGCVVGAGSVVTRNVPANVLVAGVPARVVRELVE